MNPRQIYFRKKGKAVAMEGKVKGRSLHIYTLGIAEKHLSRLLQTVDFFTKEKRAKILEKLGRLDYKKKSNQKKPKKFV